MQFKTELHKKRAELGITQLAMSKWLNITERMYQSYESGAVVPSAAQAGQYRKIMATPYTAGNAALKLQQEITVLEIILTEKRAQLKTLSKPPRPRK